MAIILCICLVSLYIQTTHCICNETTMTCDGNQSGEYCTSHISKLEYPNFNNFGSTINITTNHYLCKSPSFCNWLLGSADCTNIYLPDKMMKSAFMNQNTNACSLIQVPITFEKSVSCCQSNMDCESIFSNIKQDVSNCTQNTELTTVFEDLLDCYMTDDFIKYITCNQTDSNNHCPVKTLNMLTTYAICGCAIMNQSKLDNAYLYFSDMTSMIEDSLDPFTNFVNWKGNCPALSFTCNNCGDALLEIEQILCPLHILSNTDFNSLSDQIRVGVSSVMDYQVEIDEESATLRVRMYTHNDTINALSYLKSKTLIELDTGDNCIVSTNKMNLNAMLPDHVSCAVYPTEFPTETPSKDPTESITTELPTTAPEPQTNAVQTYHGLLSTLLCVIMLVKY
eukprot:272725_1